jgi:hypothetical protein
LGLQPIPKLKVFAIVIVEETEASAFWTPAFAPAMPRDHGTDCATSRKHERCRCACQFIEPEDPQVEAGMDGVARNRSKSVERFSGGMIRAEPTRVQMKALESVLHLKTQCPRRMRHRIPQEIWYLVSPGDKRGSPTKVPYETKKSLRFLGIRE